MTNKGAGKASNGVSESASRTVTANCQWCGREMQINAQGRRRKFCSQACRQRSYEKRSGTRPGASRILSLSDVSDVDKQLRDRLGDGLFEVRCLAEDLQTALNEGAETSDLREISRDLLVKTREVERLLP